MEIYLAVDGNMDEVMFDEKPIRDTDVFPEGYWRIPNEGNKCIYLKSGTIEMLTGIPEGDMTWSNEPIKLEINIKEN